MELQEKIYDFTQYNAMGPQRKLRSDVLEEVCGEQLITATFRSFGPPDLNSYHY
jgi:hypothetical protein